MSMVHWMHMEQLQDIFQLRQDPEQMQALKASMAEYGWALPLLIDASGIVWGGQERLGAFRADGSGRAPCVFREFLSSGQQDAMQMAERILLARLPWDGDVMDQVERILLDAGIELEVMEGE